MTAAVVHLLDLSLKSPKIKVNEESNGPSRKLLALWIKPGGTYTLAIDIVLLKTRHSTARMKASGLEHEKITRALRAG